MTLQQDEHSIAATRDRILSEIGPDVTFVAVSKKQPDECIEAALAAGQRVFGENRVQEAQARWADGRAVEGLKLHLIGPLQTNKAEDAVRLFDVIETLDREKLLKALVKAVDKAGVPPPDLMIQVNTGDEPQKAGVSVGDLEALLETARALWPGKITGLMCIPPADEPAAPHFALLKKLADRFGLPHVSMGMSADYPLAVQLGATHVRIGSAFFGARPPQ